MRNAVWDLGNCMAVADEDCDAAAAMTSMAEAFGAAGECIPNP